MNLISCVVNTVNTNISIFSAYSVTEIINLQIVRVANAFMNLNFINVSRNPLIIYDIKEETEFPNMRKLVMNNINFKSDKLHVLLKLFPKLVSLYILCSHTLLINTLF